MGEVVLSSEELMEKKSEGMVKWEGFLQRMALRVLLVEADDSTRQIIAALLRKSTFRVTAVPDGLKAWEILRGRPHNIDLILTEVDLPSISGFALLTLIMEHEICKNIPVIMMSSQDSVSTVYKCMLRGAADYLVKPLRRNELRNLWQHVWRRQSSTTGGNVDQDESVGQQKIEGTSENDAVSNHSSGHVACIQRNDECVEKGSDAQSSCTKPDFEAESAQMEEMQDFSRPFWGKSLQNDVEMLTHETSINYGQQMLIHESEVGGSEVAATKDANIRNLGKDVEPESQRKDVTFTREPCNELVNSSREAIDFMGACKNQNSCSNNGASRVDSTPDLDLSLRRSHPGGFENQVADQRFTIRHSNASAFTRYTNRSLQPVHSTLPGACNQQKEFAAGSEKTLSDIVTISNSDTPLVLSTQRSISSLATSQSNKSERETLCPQQKPSPVPIPVKGMRLNSLCTGYGSAIPHIFCAKLGLSSMPSPSSANQRELTFQVNPVHCGNVESSNCSQLYDRLGENAINSISINQTMQMLSHRLETLEDRGHISPATDQSASSSFCNGAISHLNSIGYGSTCGSNSNVDQVATGRAAAESKNEEGFCPTNGNSHRSIEREAALTKFRLKRKDRCYDKKVRYESRKKLAEQRPRVKGQFVRQAQPDSMLAES